MTYYKLYKKYKSKYNYLSKQRGADPAITLDESQTKELYKYLNSDPNSFVCKKKRKVLIVFEFKHYEKGVDNKIYPFFPTDPNGIGGISWQDGTGKLPAIDPSGVTVVPGYNKNDGSLAQHFLKNTHLDTNYIYEYPKVKNDIFAVKRLNPLGINNRDYVLGSIKEVIEASKHPYPDEVIDGFASIYDLNMKLHGGQSGVSRSSRGHRQRRKHEGISHSPQELNYKPLPNSLAISRRVSESESARRRGFSSGGVIIPNDRLVDIENVWIIDYRFNSSQFWYKLDTFYNFLDMFNWGYAQGSRRLQDNKRNKIKLTNPEGKTFNISNFCTQDKADWGTIGFDPKSDNCIGIYGSLNLTYRNRQEVIDEYSKKLDEYCG